MCTVEGACWHGGYIVLLYYEKLASGVVTLWSVTTQLEIVTLPFHLCHDCICHTVWVCPLGDWATAKHWSFNHGITEFNNHQQSARAHWSVKWHKLPVVVENLPRSERWLPLRWHYYRTYWFVCTFRERMCALSNCHIFLRVNTFSLNVMLEYSCSLHACVLVCVCVCVHILMHV